MECTLNTFSFQRVLLVCCKALAVHRLAGPMTCFQFTPVLLYLFVGCCSSCDVGTDDFLASSVVTIDAHIGTATANISLSKVCVSAHTAVDPGDHYTLHLRDARGGDHVTDDCREHVHSREPLDSITVLKFTCPNLPLDRTLTISLVTGELTAEIHQLVYTTSVQSVEAHHTSGSNDVTISCTFARGTLPPSCRGCVVELVDLNNTEDRRSFNLFRTSSITSSSVTISGLVSGHSYNITARDWLDSGEVSGVVVKGDILKVDSASTPVWVKYAIYASAVVGAVLVLACLIVSISLTVHRAKRKAKHALHATEASHPCRRPIGTPFYQNIPQANHLDNHPSSQNTNHLGNPRTYQNVFPLQDQRPYQNVNPRAIQLQDEINNSPVSSHTDSCPASTCTGRSTSTYATESTGIDNTAIDLSSVALNGVFDNAEDFESASSAPSQNTSEHSHPSYTNVFSVSSSMDSISNISIESSSLSSEPPPSPPPYTDEMHEEVEINEEGLPPQNSCHESNSNDVSLRIVTDGSAVDENDNESSAANPDLNEDESSQTESIDAGVTSQDPDPPPPVPPYTLLMFSQKIDPDAPMERDPDWMRPPPLIPNYSKQMHELCDSQEDEKQVGNLHTRSPQKVVHFCVPPFPPDIEDDKPLKLSYFEKLQRAGKWQFDVVTDGEQEISAGHDKMTLGEFFGHQYEEVKIVDSDNPDSFHSYLRPRSDLRPLPSHEFHDPTENDSYRVVYNLAYGLKKLKK